MTLHRYRVTFRTLRGRNVEYKVRATDAVRAEMAARALAHAERRSIARAAIEVRRTS